MGVPILLKGLEPALVHDVLDIVLVFIVRNDMVLPDRLADDFADGHTGLKGSKRVLEDDLHMGPLLVQFFLGKVIDLFAVEDDVPGRFGAFQSKNGPARRGLAAAGLADEAHCRSPGNGEGNAVHGLDPAYRPGKYAAHDGIVFLQIPDLEDVIRIIHAVCHHSSPF